MRGKIKFIADIKDSIYERVDFEEFKEWIVRQQSFQIDIETNITERWDDTLLISIQFGSCTSERVQWFLQWSELSVEQRNWLIDFLNNSKAQKLAHNARFEYIVLRYYGIILENLYDTMLAEKVLKGGIENVNYSLADISWKYLRIIMNKEEQSNFGDNIITDSKILYGCTDVSYLDVIKKQQIEEADLMRLSNVMALEMEVLPAFGDMTYEGVLLDKVKWRENIKLAEPIVQQTLDDCNKWLNEQPFHDYAVDTGILSNEDRLFINFKSHQQRGQLLQMVFPDIQSGSGPIVKKYIRDNAMALSVDKLNILTAYVDKDYQPLQDWLLKHCRQELINWEYLVPAGQCMINWNSRDQVLPLAQLVEPRLKGLSEEEVAKTTHKLLKNIQDYKEAVKLLTTYGEEFIRKHVYDDGSIHGNYNQIVSTGRVSMSGPNLQQVVVSELVGNRYRESFVARPGCKFCGGDYVSQELIMISYISKDPVWMKAIELEEDLHSVCAELLYKQKWKDAAEDDCDYYKMVVGPDGILKPAHKKCSCKKHKPLRYDVKSINFMLAYGGGPHKLAGTLEIDLKAAENLIKEYFRTFPAIGKTLKFLGEFGVRNGYIITLSPFFRRRYFPYWREYSAYIDMHLDEIKYIPTLGEIERASKNHPIQGGSADITKTAMVLVRNYIRDNDLRDKVKMVLQIHDEILTEVVCDGTFEYQWKDILNSLMVEAGKLVIPTGILKADVALTDMWTK